MELDVPVAGSRGLFHSGVEGGDGAPAATQRGENVWGRKWVGSLDFNAVFQFYYYFFLILNEG
jgi:hypothetical protein